MKNITKLSLLAAALLAAVPFTHAATTEAAATPAEPAKPAHHRGHPALRAEVAKRLDLTAEQRAKLKTEREQTASAIKAIRADASLTAEQKRAKIHETLENARQTARAELTPEQQAKLDKMREHLKHRRGRG